MVYGKEEYDTSGFVYTHNTYKLDQLIVGLALHNRFVDTKKNIENHKPNLLMPTYNQPIM